MRWMRRRWLLGMLLLGPPLASCATAHQTPIAGTVSVMCRDMRPVAYSMKDTPLTITQVQKNNAAWHAVCGTGVSTPGSTVH